MTRYRQITIPHLDFRLWIRSSERTRSPFLDPLFYFSSEKRREHRLLITRAERIELALGGMHFLSLRMLNRFMNGVLDRNHARFTLLFLRRYIQLKTLFTIGKWCEDAETLQRASPPDFQALMKHLERSDGRDWNLFAHVVQKVVCDLGVLFANASVRTEKISLPAPDPFGEHFGGEFPQPQLTLMKDIAEREPASFDFFGFHGSYATKDFVPSWSDFDAVVFLSSQALASEKKLLAVRTQFQKMQPIILSIDILTHHGILFLSPSDRRWYPQYFLPLVVYRHALSLSCSSNALDFRVRNDRYEKIQAFFRFLQHFRKRVAEQQHAESIGEWKTDIANALLLPSLLLQARGEYLYKKYSFERFPNVFPEIDFSVVEEASRLRTSWKFWSPAQHWPISFLRYLPASVNALALKRFHYQAKKKPIPHSRQYVEEFVMRTLFFCETSFDSLFRG